MTVPVLLARLAEGWCPHPDHGRLRENCWCPACDAWWRTTPWLTAGGLPALICSITWRAGDRTRMWNVFVDSELAAADTRGAASAIADSVSDAHRQAAAGPPEQEPTP